MRRRFVIYYRLIFVSVVLLLYSCNSELVDDALISAEGSASKMISPANCDYPEGRFLDFNGELG